MDGVWLITLMKNLFRFSCGIHSHLERDNYVWSAVDF